MTGPRYYKSREGLLLRMRTYLCVCVCVCVFAVFWHVRPQGAVLQTVHDTEHTAVLVMGTARRVGLTQRPSA